MLLLPLQAAAQTASQGASQTASAAADPPRFKAQLEWRAGHLAIDSARSELQLGAHAALFGDCGFTPQALRSELVTHLEGIYRSMGPLFEGLAVPAAESDEAKALRLRVEPAFRALAAGDESTRRLMTLSAPWPEATRELAAWWQRHKDRADPPVAMGEPDAARLYKAAEFHAALADGPLLPQRAAGLRDEPADPALLRAGQIVFNLAPPLVQTQGRIRPVSNVAQWDGLRQGLADNAIAPLHCQLWYRQRVIDNVQDYLELRGLSVQPYRVPRDGSARTGLEEPAPQPPPPHSAGIGPERTRFPTGSAGVAAAPASSCRPPVQSTQASQGYGGRVLLLPDPLVRTVFIETGGRGEDALWPALYLLLPTPDFAAVRAAPHEYLCRTGTVWKPATQGQPVAEAARLDMDRGRGASLSLARLFMTPPELAPRLRRMAAIGYQAGIKFTEDVLEDDAEGCKQRLRVTKLIAEPLAPPEAAAPAASATVAAAGGASATYPSAAHARPLPTSMPACRDAPPPADQVPQPIKLLAGGDAAASDTSSPPPLARDEPNAAKPATGAGTAAGAAATQAARHDAPLRNEIVFSAEKPAGKPLALGAEFSHQGLQPGDQYSLGMGRQRKGSVNAGYSRDFIAFPTFGRRVQATASAFSSYRAERPLAADAPAFAAANDDTQDERREGASLRATVDLWRDVRGSFGQAELGLTRTRTTLQGSRQALPEVTLAELTFVVAQDEHATHAAPHSEGQATLGAGRSAGQAFGKASVDLSHQRFVRAFERLDLHLRAARVGRAAPGSEQITFGGEDSVRGYRSEWALARQAASLQGEYWLRWPWLPQSETLARLVRRNVALAVFADVGTFSAAVNARGAASGVADERRTIAGAGLGLRYSQGVAPRLTLKLDLARALAVDGALPRDERRTRLHFSVSTQQTL
jgi:hypothetical protein